MQRREFLWKMGGLMAAVAVKPKPVEYDLTFISPEENFFQPFCNYFSLDNLTAGYRQRLFGNPNTPWTMECMPLDAEVRREQLMYLSVPSNQTFFYDATTLTPIALLTLKPGTQSYRNWESLRAKSEDDSRNVTSAVARSAFKAIENRTGIKTKDIGYHTGFADNTLAGLHRLGPFAPYLSSLAEAHGIDPMLPLAQALVESTARNIGEAYNGFFQMGAAEAKLRGAIVNERKVVRGKLPMNRKVVDERYHPILEAYCYVKDINARSRITGSILSTPPSYHAGEGNLELIEQLAVERNPDIARALLAGDISGLPAPLQLLRWVYQKGYKDPKNTSYFKTPQGKKRFSGFQENSGLYNPRVCAVVHGIRQMPDTKLFAADQITISYGPKKPLTARQLAVLFPSETAFTQLNPHIPITFTEKTKVTKINPPIPEGTRVFAPLGRGEDLAKRLNMPLLDLVQYNQGNISPAPAIQWTMYHEKYAALASPRVTKGIDGADPVAIKELADQVESLIKETGDTSLKSFLIDLKFDHSRYTNKKSTLSKYRDALQKAARKK